MVEYDSTIKGLKAKNVTLEKNLNADNPKIRNLLSQYHIANRQIDEMKLPIKTIGFLPKSSI